MSGVCQGIHSQDPLPPRVLVLHWQLFKAKAHQPQARIRWYCGDSLLRICNGTFYNLFQRIRTRNNTPIYSTSWNLVTSDRVQLQGMSLG